MITAFVTSTIVAIIFICLFIEEHHSMKEYLKENKEQRKVDLPAADENSQDLWEITPQLISDAVKFAGYVPLVSDNFVEFRIQGEKYFIRTERLPYLTVDKGYVVDPEDFDIELMRQAAAIVTRDIFIGKITLSDDGTVLRFQADAFEPSYGHFRDSIQNYLSIIVDTQERFREVYDDLREKKEKLDNPTMPGLLQDAGRTEENKIMS